MTHQTLYSVQQSPLTRAVGRVLETLGGSVKLSIRRPPYANCYLLFDPHGDDTAFTFSSIESRVCYFRASQGGSARWHLVVFVSGFDRGNLRAVTFIETLAELLTLQQFPRGLSMAEYAEEVEAGGERFARTLAAWLLHELKYRTPSSLLATVPPGVRGFDEVRQALKTGDARKAQELLLKIQAGSQSKERSKTTSERG